jgi:beta-galactosidase/beta-glucuronidase
VGADYKRLRISGIVCYWELSWMLATIPDTEIVSISLCTTKKEKQNVDNYDMLSSVRNNELKRY